MRTAHGLSPKQLLFSGNWSGFSESDRQRLNLSMDDRDFWMQSVKPVPRYALTALNFLITVFKCRLRLRSSVQTLSKKLFFYVTKMAIDL